MTLSESRSAFQTTTLDDSPPGYRVTARFRVFAEIAGGVVMMAGVLAYTGLSISIYPVVAALNSQSITPTLAACFALSGFSLALQVKASRHILGRRLAKIVASIVVLLALRAAASSSTLSTLSVNSALQVVPGPAAALSVPGPFPEALALSLLLVGLSLLLLVDPPIFFRQKAKPLAYLRAGSVSLFALVGYACTIAGGLIIPPAQALALTLLYLGIIFAQPDRGPIAIIISDSIGGYVARRLFFTALAVPLLLGWLNLAFQQLGLYEAHFGSSLLVAGIIIVLAAFIVLNSSSLERLDRQRQLAESTQRENEQRLTIQYMLTRVLAESSTLEEAAPRVLQTTCQSIGWAIGALWLVDSEAPNLRLSSFWHLPGLNLDGFEQACRNYTFQRGVGLPGRVWSTGEPLCLMTALDDPNFTRGRVALKYGLHAGFAFPVLVGSEVIGVIEFFSRETRKLDDGMLQIFTTFGDQLGQFIQRKQAEEALSANQLLTRMLIERAYDAYIAIDQQGKITDWNAQAEKTFGWTRTEALGRSLDELIIPPPVSNAEAQGLEPFRISRGELLLNKRMELKALRRDGQEFPVEIALIPIGQGEQETHCAFVHDITERKRSEDLLVQAMRTEQRVAQAIVEHAPLGIARLDNDLVITDVNQVMSRLLGPPADDLIGADLFELQPSLPRTPFLNTIRTSEPFVAENYKITFSNGLPTPDTYWDIAVWPIKGEKENPKGLILLISDATGRVELVRQREDFVATLTHDLKAPLMGADRTLEMLREEAFGALDDNEKEVISKLQRSNQELLNMIENLLEIYRYESGTEQFIFEKVDLAPLVGRAIHGLSPIAQDKKIRIKSVLAPDLGELQADPMALARVLTNLIMNAIKFTPAGGTIEIRGERFADNVVLDVKDTGIGIKPEEQEKVFQRFWRAESSLYKTGSGLGLYLCWQIISAHHGKISCQSERDMGTTFSIVLPLAQLSKSRAVTRSH